MKPSSITTPNTPSIPNRKFVLKKIAYWLIGLFVLVASLIHIQVRFNPFEIELMSESDRLSCRLDAGLGSKVQPWLMWCR